MKNILIKVVKFCTKKSGGHTFIMFSYLYRVVYIGNGLLQKSLQLYMKIVAI